MIDLAGKEEDHAADDNNNEYVYDDKANVVLPGSEIGTVYGLKVMRIK